MRELDINEQALVELLKRFEEMCEAPRLTVEIHFDINSLTWLSTHGIRILRCDYVKSTGQYAALLLKSEYRKYLDLCCKSVGFEVSVDGTVTTHDNLTVLIGNCDKA